MSKISLVFDAIIALILSVYIVYIIEDTKLQNITLVLVSSFIGALVILLGTMKTISYTKCENRKEEIKSLKPYLLLGSEDKKIKVSDSIFNSSILTNEIVSGKGLIESIVRDANIKVSNQNDCIVIGLIINDKYYPYDKKTFLERGSSIRFNVLNGQLLDFVDEIDNISIVCEDVLGNAYKYMLNLGRDINEDDVTTLTIVGIDTPCPYKIICSNRYHL